MSREMGDAQPFGVVGSWIDEGMRVPDEQVAFEIPVERLSAEALQGVVEEFVTRDGTDYGEQEASLTTKRQQVMDQVLAGDVAIMFDLNTASCNLVPRTELEGRK